MMASRTREHMENQDTNGKATPSSGKKITSRQIAALIGVALLILLYIATLIAAVTDTSDSGRWFMGCIFGTVAIPLLIWIYTWIYGKLTGRHTIADTPQGQEEDTAAGIAAEMPAQAEAISSDSGQK